MTSGPIAMRSSSGIKTLPPSESPEISGQTMIQQSRQDTTHEQGNLWHEIKSYYFQRKDDKEPVLNTPLPLKDLKGINHYLLVQASLGWSNYALATISFCDLYPPNHRLPQLLCILYACNVSSHHATYCALTPPRHAFQRRRGKDFQLQLCVRIR